MNYDIISPHVYEWLDDRDEDYGDELQAQEPLPANQIYQLPSEEPTNEKPITYIHTHNEHK